MLCIASEVGIIWCHWRVDTEACGFILELGVPAANGQVGADVPCGSREDRFIVREWVCDSSCIDL